MNANRREPQTSTGISLEFWPLLKTQGVVLAFGLFLMAINRVCGLALPYSTKFLIDDVLAKGRHDLLLPIVAAVLTTTIIQALTAFAATRVIGASGNRLIAKWRCIVQSHVGRLPVAYFDANSTGALLSRIMGDIEGLRTLAGTGLIELVSAVLAAVLALFVMTHISAQMTCLAIGIILVFAVGLFKGFRALQPIFKERSQVAAEVSGRLHETLAGVRVVKCYRAEDREAAVFARGARRLLDNALRLLAKTSTLSMASTMLVGLIGAAISYVGIRQVISGALTLGGFVTFTAMMAFLVSPVFQMVSIGSQMTEALAGLERTRELLAEKREDEDPRRTVLLGSAGAHIEFRNVSFGYEPGKAVLHDISFEALPDTVTAIVGPSGAGKSTLISLILAAHAPFSGQILVDGLDLSTIQLDSYRRHLGVVLQDSFLFDGSIRDNVAFSRPDATEAEILEACHLALVDEFAETFDRQYETHVGERGVRLSGGQRQRVSIARAILADPRILILDEATSSLDTESEALIKQALSNVMRGRTTFVIAHRLSTIRNASQILVLDHGHIVERGMHETLYANGARYAALYGKQESFEADRLAEAVSAEGEDGIGVSPVLQTGQRPGFMNIASLL